jgi:hypothetical protein
MLAQQALAAAIALGVFKSLVAEANSLPDLAAT